ncbi:MAG: hypothetical protein WKF84_26510 [Pyrinomonadaceae bacterium]
MSSIRPTHFLALLLLLLLLLLPICVSAQEGRCTLKLAQLPRVPELRGFHLGMTADRIQGTRSASKVGAHRQAGIFSRQRFSRVRAENRCGVFRRA